MIISDHISCYHCGDDCENDSIKIVQILRDTEFKEDEELGTLNFELSKGRLVWSGPLGNIFGDKKVEAQSPSILNQPEEWLKKVRRMKQLHSDVQWPVGIVLSRTDKGIEVGYEEQDKATKRKLFTRYKSKWGKKAIQSLKLGDLIFVKLQKKNLALRILPKVQGAVVAMEAHTGRVIAMTGGSSYYSSQSSKYA